VTLDLLQTLNRESLLLMKTPFRSASEIMLALTEELGEIAQEVALVERIGSKAEWERSPQVERMAEEMAQLINLIAVLANHYEIDLNRALAASWTQEVAS
jgi:NTP pyrophosphatase (non-canonical NTP hydrolase)